MNRFTDEELVTVLQDALGLFRLGAQWHAAQQDGDKTDVGSIGRDADRRRDAIRAAIRFLEIRNNGGERPSGTRSS